MSLLHATSIPASMVPQLDTIDPDTAAVIAQLALDDLGVFAAQTGNPIDDDQVYASSLAAALIADAAYLEAIIAAEEAAAQDRLVAEMLSRGEELPPQTAAQMRLENPNFVMHPDLPASAAIVVDAIQHREGKQSESILTLPTLDPVPEALQPDTDTTPITPQALEEIVTERMEISTTVDHFDPNHLATALITDAAYLEAAAIAEQAAVDDRLAAETLSRGEPLPPQTAAQIRLENPDFVMHPDPPATAVAPIVPQLEEKAKGKSADIVGNPMCATKVYNATLDLTPLEEYTNWNHNASILDNVQKPKSEFDYPSLAPGPSVNRNKWVQCTVCYDPLTYRKALQTPCDHYYCGTCIVSLVEKSTVDESLFPPRCCQKPIPLTDVDSFISSALHATLQQKHFEFSVPSKARIYCFERTCSTFLGSSEGLTSTGIACSKCTRSTCPRCKQAEHADDDCVVNESTIQLRALAQQQRWQTCPGCHAVVELTAGCYHMACRCGEQFCYQCGARWKTCAC